MLYILYKNTGVYSGRALRKELEKLYEGPVRGGFPGRFQSLLRKGQKPELVVNLGTTEEFAYKGSTLNTPSCFQQEKGSDHFSRSRDTRPYPLPPRPRHPKRRPSGHWENQLSPQR